MSQEKDELLREALPWLPPKQALKTFFALWEWRPMVAEARKLLPKLRRQRQDARRLCDRLLSYPPEEQEMKIRWSRGRYLSPPLARELIRRSREHLFDRPAEAVHLALLAREVAWVLVQKPELCGGRAGMFDLAATAHAHAGNAFRVARQWEEAERAFAVAFACRENGSCDVLLEAELLSLQGSLLFERFQLAKAVTALRRSERIYRRQDYPRLRSRVLLKLANAFSEKGELRKAYATNLEACGLLDERREPRLVVYAWHNQAYFCARLGAFTEAELHLRDVPSMLGRFAPGRKIQANFAWVHGKVDLGLGRPWRAEERFREALSGFEALGDCFDAALVRLDLAALYLEENRLQEVEAAAEAAFAGLEAQKLHEDVARAMQLLLESARRQQVTAELVRAAAEALRTRNLLYHAEPSNRPTR